MHSPVTRKMRKCPYPSMVFSWFVFWDGIWSNMINGKNETLPKCRWKQGNTLNLTTHKHWNLVKKNLMGLKKGLWQCEGLRVCLYSIWSFETSTSHQSLVSYYVIYNHNWHILAENEWGNTNLSHYHRRKVLPWKWRTEEVENNLLCL